MNVRADQGLHRDGSKVPLPQSVHKVTKGNKWLSSNDIDLPDIGRSPGLSFSPLETTP
jgi:hypothetical protein